MPSVAESSSWLFLFVLSLSTTINPPGSRQNRCRSQRPLARQPFYIGQPGDGAGMPLKVCIVATTELLTMGQQLDQLPGGEICCVDVTRNTLRGHLERAMN